ncbi:MAG: threonine aldolase family protein [Thermomicrobiales bacterium]
MIDLSSDTATRPTPEMRRCMAEAPVGDEQRREDPTVNELQRYVAELTGKEAALFLPSGTMCNAIAFIVHCQRGDAVIIDRSAHPVISEGGGPAVLAGALLRTVDGERGVFTVDQARAEVTPGGTHTSRTAMISVENTTNRGGGKIWPIERLAELRNLADVHGMVLHMDGARLMNAVVASDVPASVYAGYTDTVWIDLSKGLGAPVGGILAGTTAFIEEARLWKHRLGGAMRQAGVIAAAGLYAFRHHVDRLAEDHANAKLLEAGIQTIPGVRQINGPVETNILFFDVTETGKSALEVERALEERGVRMSPYITGTTIRAVTHLDVSRADCERAVEALREAVA